MMGKALAIFFFCSASFVTSDLMTEEIQDNFNSATFSNEKLKELRQLMKKIVNVKKQSVLQQLGIPLDSLDKFQFSDDENERFEYLYEGDILLTVEQAGNLLTSYVWDTRHRRTVRSTREIAKNIRRRLKRKLYSVKASRWPSTHITFSHSPSLHDFAQKRIEEGLKMWELDTCFRFQRTTKPSPTSDSIRFFRGSGCYSSIGRTAGPQGISIGWGCEQPGVVAHEVGHALGLWHEQSRPDSACCIKVKAENIYNPHILLYNFLPQRNSQVETLDIPFDFGSIMQYGPKAFAQGQKDSIQTEPEGYQRTIGQRDSPSFYDVKFINQAYCQDRCETELPCQNGGYTHPVACHRCICPDGLGGAFCELNEPPKNAVCGGVIDLITEWVEVTSPGWPTPGFGLDVKCSWLIRAPRDRKVMLEFVGQQGFYCVSTCRDYIEIKNGTDLANTGMRICCQEQASRQILSDSNQIIVIFRVKYFNSFGFKARVRMFPPFRRALEFSTPSFTVAPETTTTTTLATTTTTTTTPTTTPTTTTPTTTTTTTTPTPTTTTTTALTVAPNRFTTPSGKTFTGTWQEWTSWTQCSRSCGACGVRVRQRQCATPPCRGDSRQLRRCGFTPCFEDPVCHQIISFTPVCGQLCKQLLRASQRCDQPNCCPPFRSISHKCRLGTADTWSSWSAWSTCRGPSCGGCAVKSRYHVCNDGQCDGPESEYKRCNTRICENCSGFNCPCCQPLRPVNGLCVP